MKCKSLLLLTSLFLGQTALVWAMEADELDHLPVGHQRGLRPIENDWVLVENNQLDVSSLITKENMSYFKAHELNNFKALSLTEGMDLEQIVHLHKCLMINEANNSFKELTPSIAAKIIEIMDDEALGKLVLFPDFYHLIMNELDKRKSSHSFDLKNLNNVDGDYLNKYYYDIKIIDNTYNTLKFNHTVWTLFEIFEEHLETNGIFKKVENAIKDELSQKSENSDLLTKEQMYEKVCEMIDATPEFQHIYKSMLPFKKDPELYDSFRIQRQKRFLKSANKILEELSQTQSTYTKLIDLLSGIWSFSPAWPFSNWVASENKQTLLSIEAVKERVTKAGMTLQAHDPSSQGVRQFYLLKYINEMKFEDHSQLALEDFIRIHQQIFKKKYAKATMSDRAFVDQYSDEIFSYKLNNPFYRNKIFYDYSNIIERMRTKNQEFLRGLYF